MDGIQARLSDLLQHRWSALLLRGLVAIALGILVWSKPGISLSLFVVAFGVWALIDGVVTSWLAFEDRPQKAWGWMLFAGVIGIVIRLMALPGRGRRRSRSCSSSRRGRWRGGFSRSSSRSPCARSSKASGVCWSPASSRSPSARSSSRVRARDCWRYSGSSVLCGALRPHAGDAGVQGSQFGQASRSRRLSRQQG